jgi:hypothetical protein
MKYFAKTSVLRLVKHLLLSGFLLALCSPVSHARILKVGDEYAGGIVIYLFSPGDGGGTERREEIMMADQTTLSEHLYWSDAKAASDKFDAPSYGDWDEPGKSVTIVDAIESDAHTRYR